MFFENKHFEKFSKIHRETLLRESLFNKVAASGLQLYCNFIKKETLAEVFSYEFSEVFKNTCCIEYLWWLLLVFLKLLKSFQNKDEGVDKFLFKYIKKTCLENSNGFYFLSLLIRTHHNLF